MPGGVLVTGAGGFAGRHLIARLSASYNEISAPRSSEVDLRDMDQVRALVADAQPAKVFHLAALASVRRSWDEPQRALLENQAMTINLLEAVRAETPDAQVLLAGSGEVYGAPEELPVTESAPLRPQNPYAVSKAAADLLGGMYANAGSLRVVRARAFNHAGPGQSDAYVVGTLTRQIAEAEAKGLESVPLRTGNPDAGRDFTDVRDVARAYELAVDLEPGAYNVATGRAVTVRELIDVLRGLTELEIQHEVDPGRLRPGDVPEIRGSAEKLNGTTGWKPEIPLETTLADTLEHWRGLAATGV